MRYKIAICDDMEEDVKYISSAVNKWAEKENITVDIETFPSAESFLFRYAEQKTFDILLLDVEMRGISGIELAKQIRSDNNYVEIIFVTSHFELSGEGYEVDALHYLVKPITESKLTKVLSKADKKLSVEPLSLVVACNGQTIKLFEKDILYIESFQHYIVIHTNNCEYKLKENISSIAEKLSDVFYRTHRSYLVSLKHVVKISRTAVWVNNGTELPLARGKYDEINYAFIKHN